MDEFWFSRALAVRTLRYGTGRYNEAVVGGVSFRGLLGFKRKFVCFCLFVVCLWVCFGVCLFFCVCLLVCYWSMCWIQEEMCIFLLFVDLFLGLVILAFFVCLFVFGMCVGLEGKYFVCFLLEGLLLGLVILTLLFVFGMYVGFEGEYIYFFLFMDCFCFITSYLFV